MLDNVTKAEICQLDESGGIVKRFPVQFNPESLKVNFSNQVTPPANAARDTSHGTAATQHVGSGTTKMSVQLWFDVTVELPDGLAEDEPQRGDVRRLTAKVIDLMRLSPSTRNRNNLIPPGVRFLWGSFQFEGIVESIEQSLEFFSPDGIPLRASITLSMSKQDIDYTINPTNPSGLGGGPAPSPTANLPSGAPPGTNQLTQAPAGSTLQGLAAEQGKGANWQAIAEANGIENPRLLSPGQLIDMNVPASGASGLIQRAGNAGFRFGPPEG
jgi:hypothetical protein